MVEDEITYSKPRRSSEETIQADSKVAPCKVIRNPRNFGLWNPGIHGFGIRNPANGIRNPTIIVIQNPGCWLWNPESMDVESGIHRHGIRNPQHGIRNPRLS